MIIISTKQARERHSVFDRVFFLFKAFSLRSGIKIEYRFSHSIQLIEPFATQIHRAYNVLGKYIWPFARATSPDYTEHIISLLKRFYAYI